MNLTSESKDVMEPADHEKEAKTESDGRVGSMKEARNDGEMRRVGEERERV